MEIMYFYFCLLEGNYFDINCLILLSFNIEVEFFVFSFLVVIECVFLFFYEGCNNIVCLFICLDVVVLYGNFLEIGKVEESLSYIVSSGDLLEIFFNLDYMKVVLCVFGDMSIKVKFIFVIWLFMLELMEDGV